MCTQSTLQLLRLSVQQYKLTFLNANAHGHQGRAAAREQGCSLSAIMQCGQSWMSAQHTAKRASGAPTARVCNLAIKRWTRVERVVKAVLLDDQLC